MMLQRQSLPILALAPVIAVALFACGDDAIQGAQSPRIVLQPSQVLFEDIDQDLRTLEIKNEGVGTLVIDDMTVQGQAFAIASGWDGTELQIPPQESALVYIEYTVQETDGIPTGTLVLDHNDTTAAGRSEVPLVVQDSPARAFVNPNPVNFGRVPANEHAEVTATLTNIGGDPLQVANWFPVGSAVFTIHPEDEFAAMIGDGPLVLNADESVQIRVQFDPVDDGYDSGVLVVKVLNDPSLPSETLEVELQANGAEPCIDVVPSNDGAYDFGERLLNQPTQVPFTIQNCSDSTNGQPLDVSSIALLPDSSPTFALAQLPEQYPLVIAPGESSAFVVEFTPTVEFQPEAGVLVVSSNDVYVPEFEIDLTGVGSNNVPPTAVAGCTVEGSGAPPTNELFVLPLDTLTCTAAGSEDSDGEIVDYIWSVIEAPTGSASLFNPENAAETSFFVDLAGRYVFSLEVVDDRGAVSEPATVTLVARPDEDIHVQLVWNTPGDDYESDSQLDTTSGSDLDLHFLHPNGCWEDTQYDCHFRAREPNWGDRTSDADDPSLDIDDTNGAGPENINLDNPDASAIYRVAVHYYDDHGFGEARASVRIYIYGALLFEALDKPLISLGPADGQWWVVADVDWQRAAVTPIDVVYDDVPTCP